MARIKQTLRRIPQKNHCTSTQIEFGSERMVEIRIKSLKGEKINVQYVWSRHLMTQGRLEVVLMRLGNQVNVAL